MAYAIFRGTNSAILRGTNSHFIIYQLWKGNDQELTQSHPIPYPQYQKGKKEIKFVLATGYIYDTDKQNVRDGFCINSWGYIDAVVCKPHDGIYWF